MRASVDHPVAQAGPDPETDLARQRLHPLVQAPAVAGFGGCEPIAQDDPVDLFTLHRGALFATGPDGFGIEAVSFEVQRARIHDAQHVKIDEAVVHRRDDQVSANVGGTHDGGIGTGGVDQDKVRLARDVIEGRLEPRQLLGVGGLGQRVAGAADGMFDGHGRGRPIGRQPCRTVGEKVPHGLLAQVQVQHGDLGTAMEQRGDDVDGQGGFPRAAFLVADHNNAGLAHDDPLLDGRRKGRLSGA